MLHYDLDRQRILYLGNRIIKNLDGLGTAIVYLRPENVGQTLEDVCRVRGPGMLDLWQDAHDRFPFAQPDHKKGYAGFLAFWEELRTLSDRWFEAHADQGLLSEVDPDEGSVAYREISSFLDLPPPPDPPGLEELRKYEGSYKLERGNMPCGLALRAESCGLKAICDDPSLEIDEGPLICFKETRLLRKKGGLFCVAGWPFEAEFHERAGSISSMRLTPTHEGWPRSGDVYVRR
jgi:hypothetical protein